MYPLRKFLNLYAAKEKLEIVSGAAHFDFAQYRPPPFRIFAGGFFRKSAFGLIQEYCTKWSFCVLWIALFFNTFSFLFFTLAKKRG